MRNKAKRMTRESRNGHKTHFKAILRLIYLVVVLSIQNITERLKWAVNHF